MTVAERIGRNIRLTPRGVADITQEACAELAEIHLTSMTLYESGRREPWPETLLRLAGALYVEPVVLLRGIRWEPGLGAPGAFVFEETP